MREVALLDTTVTIDRIKMPERRATIESELERFSHLIVTGIGIVEFKGVVIMEMVHIHAQLSRKNARFTYVRDKATESMHRQSKLRGHIFNNIIRVWGPEDREATPEEDVFLARKARLKLQDVIPRVYDSLRNATTHTVLNREVVRCDRADERPEINGSTFGSVLPKCRRGKNKTCKVEEVIRDRAPVIIERIGAISEETHKQLHDAVSLVKKVCHEKTFEMDVSDCRKAGDLLIGIEAQGVATHAVSTNTRDWSVVAPSCGMEFVRVAYDR